MEDNVEKNTILDPWIYSPLELIKHAEEHQQTNGDFNTRIALIGYDNAIEVSINTYLQLHPAQRRGEQYQKEQVNKWLTNYHSQLDFFFDEFMKSSGKRPQIARQTFIYYHNLRNNLYHEGKNFIPTERDIKGAREAALYIFSTLFNIKGEEILKTLPPLHTWITRKFNFQGKGNDLHKFLLEVGQVIFRFKYKGERYLISYLYNENSRLIARVAEPMRSIEDEDEETGSIHIYKISNSVNIRKEGVFLLRIKALGTWEVEIEQ